MDSALLPLRPPVRPSPSPPQLRCPPRAQEGRTPPRPRPIPSQTAPRPAPSPPIHHTPTTRPPFYAPPGRPKTHSLPLPQRTMLGTRTEQESNGQKARSLETQRSRKMGRQRRRPHWQSGESVAIVTHMSSSANKCLCRVGLSNIPYMLRRSTPRL